MSEHDLKGKVIVITGASSGFGRGAALKFAEAGAAVVLAARRDEVQNEVKSAQAALEATLTRHRDMQAAAGNRAERLRIIDALDRTGGNQKEAAALLGMSRRTLVLG